nr:transposase [Effusibacillus dendaii]
MQLNEWNQGYITTTVSPIHSHFVFCPRYRRKLLVEQVETRFKELWAEICQKNACSVYSYNVYRSYEILVLPLYL